MKKKHIFRLSAFLLIVACILVILCDLFEYPNSHMSERFKTYESFEKNTVDAVYIGTSGTDRFWLSAKAFEDYGMTVYPLSIEALPSWNTLNVVKYAFKYQNPKLVIIDTRSFLWNPTENVNTDAKRSRRVADQFSLFSYNRIDAINRSLKMMNEIDPTVKKFDLSYYLPFIRYHNMWSDEDFTFGEIGRSGTKYLGYRFVSNKSIRIRAIDEPVFSDKTAELDKYNTFYLHELIDYFKENKIDALFVSSPRQIDESNVYLNNAIYKIIREESMNCINFSEKENVEKYQFDYSHDFFDEGHTNFYGAVKYTDYFAKYLSDNYDLPDHREDEKCAEWHGVYEYICSQIEKLEAKKAK